MCTQTARSAHVNTKVCTELKLIPIQFGTSFKLSYYDKFVIKKVKVSQIRHIENWKGNPVELVNGYSRCK